MALPAVTFEQLLDQQRPTIDRVIHGLARRHFLASPEIEEFRRVIQRAFERNDYELLRAFDGRCTWERYFETTITREFFEFQLAMWGQWRPSEAAKRIGPEAMLLEELVLRDHFTVHDAIDWMRTTHHVDVPRHRLQQIAAQLGMGAPSTSVRPQPPPDSLPSEQLRDALRDALALISAEDRLILELRFRDGLPLTRIAAVVQIEARPLQRRIDTITTVIRESLFTQGITTADIEALLSGGAAEAPQPQQRWWEVVLSRSREPKL